MIDDFWPYLKFALSRPEDPNRFKVAVGCLADVARAVESSFCKFLEIMEDLIKYLNNPQFDRDLKLHMFVCVGDIMLAVKESGLPYLDDLMKIYAMAYSAVLLLGQQDSDQQEYAESLKEKLIESFICITHGLNSKSQEMSLIKHLPTLMQFITTSCDKKLNPTVVSRFSLA